MLLFLSSLALAKNIIIIDAGSTGSRLYIYTYDDIYNLSSYDQIRDSDGKPVSIKSSIPLSDTLNNESKLVEYFDVLLDKGSHNYIEKTMRSTTPLYLFASGGLNYIESEKARKTVMNDAFQYVNQKYRYLVKDNYFQIVTGKEEAEFAWIAANHFLGGFDSNNIMGVAEIGGTHAQIAFGVSKPSSDAKKYVESISVNKKKYKVFRNSWKTMEMLMSKNQFFSI
ncbi:hypothetical protein TVAG_275500 [Trichomonas vaginalis G3]|uniref:Uncharacterized protein n=1 Tax=Trichomonas vaginalis (strain ATCC PRA-98 / G3) TaxID=412133 RepID=A2FAQ4_TRIV3|nr:8-oxo-dGTP phosphohydrolase protein [Trichomonas vaginalis G3]EAX98040.1 hypothetical protein TVAG_275500 [Trichomonas vaginalis G3]KAI5528573.1 8-oxo-dGTP phosphohydrolase protein [Trichomonas vaginalis G3]|eukprot:XP_001310970.1 hypothetical protein [Trichomonas vaginalis G3]